MHTLPTQMPSGGSRRLIIICSPTHVFCTRGAVLRACSQVICLRAGVLRQVVGLRNGWQTAAVMSGVSTKIHAKRLAQATEVVLELRAGGVRHFLRKQRSCR